MIVLRAKTLVCIGSVTLIPKPGAMCYVNGKEVTTPTQLHSGNRVILGKCHVFRFTHPKEARESKHNLSGIGIATILRVLILRCCQRVYCLIVADEQPIDWYYAQRELLEKQGVDLKLEMETKYVRCH